jgi:hypothetical protein
VGETVTEHNPGGDHSRSGVPRWVKGFGIVGVVLLLLIVVMLLTGHGPGDHMQGLGPTAAAWQSMQTDVPIDDWP